MRNQSPAQQVKTSQVTQVPRQRCAMATAVLRVAFFLLLLPGVVHTESHWESYAGWVEAYQWLCYPYYYTYCNNWYNYGYYLGSSTCGCGLFQPYSDVCYTAVAYNCFTNCLGWIPVTLWRCQWGWKGCNCDIPICDNPVCRVDQICITPNYCDCSRSATGQCILAPCDDGPLTNCYPGYCDKTSDWKCVCPPGFSGPNCQTITNTPDINTCTVQVFGTPDGGRDQEVARANECAASGLDPLPIWIGSMAANSLTSILVTWEADYSDQLPLPDRGRAPYINNAPVSIGIVESNFTVSFPKATSLAPRSVFCINIEPSGTILDAIKQCSVSMQWKDLGASNLILTNSTFVVSIEATVGGAKVGDSNWVGGRFYTPQKFSRDPNMNTTIRTAKFAFDLEPPYHCLSTSSNCSVFPIFLNQTMTSNPVIQPTFNAWNDDGSGISRFHVEVYFMQPDQQGLLVELGSPLVTADVNITLNNFRYTCILPGAYSIILTVYDKANNSAKARKIFNYDSHESSVQETASPIYLDKANPATNYQYITSLEKLQNPDGSYQFNLVWTGHFDTTYKKEWLGAVKAWQVEDTGTVIDDNRGTTYGLRSIDAVTVKTGVLGYEIAYVVDRNGTGGVGLSAPSKFAAVSDPTATSFPVTINSNLKDGDTIVVWLRAYDLYGKKREFQTRTYVDTSKFNTNVTKTEFRKHFPEQYNSSVAITVRNRISGILNITYQIYDNSRKNGVYSGSMTPKVLEAPPSFTRKKREDTVEMPCAANDKTCYCIASGDCFNVTQMINIDNCWIDRGVSGDQVLVNFQINTFSGWSVEGSVDAGILVAEDISCRDVPPSLSREAKIGIGIAVAIIGILFILLIILLILMCIRWKVYHKHPIPYGIQTKVHNTFSRDRTPSTIDIMSDNELYSNKEEIKLSKSTIGSGSSMLWTKRAWTGNTEDNFDHKLVSGKDLQMGEVIAEGRFAVIRKGFLTTGNEKSTVAVKVLRNGYDKTDPEVMRSKVAFMANKVKPHPNIIRFIGAVAEEKNQAAPVMLLELCDKPLKDWLGEVSTVDCEVFEDMLSFSLQIARGMRHLHDQGIIHRRLAVRNILLKHTLSGYEIKLIGFGPARDDYDPNSNDHSTLSVSVVPLKWLAPETLDTLDSTTPVYDKETDAWSYGVTIWEIFSKGEAPFASHKSPDMKSVLKRGERLNCPESCPPELFNQVMYPCWNSIPKKRPSFTVICAAIEQFRNGTGSSGYYTGPGQHGSQANPPSHPPPGYYAAGSLLSNHSRLQDNSAETHMDARSG